MLFPIKISQNSFEDTCAGVSFFKKLQDSSFKIGVLKKRLQHRCFTVDNAEFLRAIKLWNTYRRPLLKFENNIKILNGRSKATMLKSNKKLKVSTLF